MSRSRRRQDGPLNSLIPGTSSPPRSFPTRRRCTSLRLDGPRCVGLTRPVADDAGFPCADAHRGMQKSSDVSNESNGPSTASEANLQTFLDTFVCQANTNGTGYFFFEVRPVVPSIGRGLTVTRFIFVWFISECSSLTSNGRFVDLRKWDRARC